MFWQHHTPARVLNAHQRFQEKSAAQFEPQGTTKGAEVQSSSEGVLKAPQRLPRRPLKASKKAPTLRSEPHTWTYAETQGQKCAKTEATKWRHRCNKQAKRNEQIMAFEILAIQTIVSEHLESTLGR